MTKYAWKVDEREVRNDVKDNLPKDREVRVFKVTSGDTGKTYWVQVMLCTKAVPIYLCDCPEGKFKIPLLILGLREFTCKHGLAVEEAM